MFKRRPTLISIASETNIQFVLRLPDGTVEAVGDYELAAFLDVDAQVVDLSAAVSGATHELLVVPDYWVGNTFQPFQTRKRSLVAAFVERQLKQSHPGLEAVADFYATSFVSGTRHGQQLYTFFLQEMLAYQLYARLQELGISPLRITTAALMWQARLAELAGGVADGGLGLVHLGASNCFLYFFYMGKFLFSRHIQLPAGSAEQEEIYNLLNYEINQSFYLFSQKTKGAVEHLLLTGPDPAATERLTELLGREVRFVETSGHSTPDLDAAGQIPACQAFGPADFRRSGDHCLTYKPLGQELAWRPVQWTGIAAGVILALLVGAESAYLVHRSTLAAERMQTLQASVQQSPRQRLREISQSLETITQELARPSGGGSVMRALLAMPEAVSVRSIALQLEEAPRLKMEAMVRADSPDAFQTTLRTFLDRINHSFKFSDRPLREKDVDIRLERNRENEKRPLYLIRLDMQL